MMKRKHPSLTFTVLISLTAFGSELKPFVSDGCSLFPDGWIGKQDEWLGVWLGLPRFYAPCQKKSWSRSRHTPVEKSQILMLLRHLPGHHSELFNIIWVRKNGGSGE